MAVHWGVQLFVNNKSAYFEAYQPSACASAVATDDPSVAYTLCIGFSVVRILCCVRFVLYIQD